MIDDDIDFTDKKVFIKKNTNNNNNNFYRNNSYLRPEYRSSSIFFKEKDDFGAYFDENNNYIIKNDFDGNYCYRCGIILIREDYDDLCIKCYEIVSNNKKD